MLNAAQQAQDSAAAAHAELRLAVALCGRGRHAEAVPTINQCIAAFDNQADQHGLAEALYWSAVCDFNLRSFQAGRRTAMRTLELARKLADRQIQFLALRILAMTQVYLPDYREEAIKSSDEALAIVREFGHPTWELEILHTAGHVANIVGHHQAAIDMSSQALELRRKLEMTFNEADWLGIVGDAHQGLVRQPPFAS